LINQSMRRSFSETRVACTPLQGKQRITVSV
jgi:hypothetical protein